MATVLPAPIGSGESRRAGIRRDEPRNLASLALTTAIVRVGWIFKTESVIIPAFVDAIAGPGWLRGMLPVLNRLGQSLPPFLLARRLKVMPRKRRALAWATGSMGASFLLLAAALQLGGDSLPIALFLLLYTLFFCATGVHQLAMGTLQGKLIRADRRGRLLAWATMGGTLPAIGFAWWLLPGWLDDGMPGYVKIFCFTGATIAGAGLVANWLREPPDAWQEDALGLRAQLDGAWQILVNDRPYRLLVIVNVLFTMSLILIPHYQALARERLGLEGTDMMLWVVSQNVMIGLASVVVGPLADRVGNRSSLRLVIFVSAAIPPASLAVTRLEPELGRALFTAIFVGIGLMPIGLRLLANYVLELAPESDHPRYLSLAQLCTAAVLCTSPLLGLMVDAVGYEPVFLGVAAAMSVGGVLTWRLVEPRHALESVG